MVQHAEVAAPAPTDRSGGWHLVEWGCELVGTALLIIGGLSAVCLDFGGGGPVVALVPDYSARLLVTGLLFAGTGSIVAITPIGRRSGAHLNPAVTLAFWRRGHVHPHDLAGYIAAQVAGAFVGAAIVRWVWGARATRVHLGATQPGHGIGAWGALGVEALMTALLVGGILAMVSSRSTARWTPLFVWLAVAFLVWQGAPWTGASLNPARSLAPAVLAPETTALWAYLIGPLLGSLVAVSIYGLVPGAETLTAKLFHDRRYASTMQSTLAVTRRG
jgi:aquaporin Z